MSLCLTRTAVENKPGLTEPSTRTCENVSRLLANVLISGSLTENDSTDREELPSNRFCRPRLTHSASTELDSWFKKKTKNKIRERVFLVEWHHLFWFPRKRNETAYLASRPNHHQDTPRGRTLPTNIVSLLSCGGQRSLCERTVKTPGGDTQKASLIV